MTLLFTEGFGSSNDLNDLLIKWDSASDIGNAGFATGRIPGLGHSFAFNGTSLKTRSLTSHATYIVGFGFYNVNLPADPVTILNFNDSTTTNVNIRFNPTTRFWEARRGSTSLGTGTTPCLEDTWYYIEVKVTVNSSTGVVTLKVNAASDIALTSQNTQVGGAAQTNVVEFASTNKNGKYRLDDIYVLNTAGSLNNDFLGDVKVETVKITGAGNSTQWTPTANYDNYDAVAGPSSNEIIATSTADNIDLYTYNDIAKISSIKAVVVNMVARNSDSTSHVMTDVVRRSSTNYAGSNQTVNTSGYKNYQFIRETDPSTAAAWANAAAVNAGEFGVKLIS